MAEFGNGYGSECHLLRYLGRHRKVLNASVLAATGGDSVSWLDFPFAKQWPDLKRPNSWPDREWLSLDFLPPDSEVVVAWRQRWPHGSGVMNWDAVGELTRSDGIREWLLVEAKAHLGEITQNCTATSPVSIAQIEQVMNETKSALGVSAERDWLRGYYQFANRLAILQHLSRHGVGARLLFIYFCGDLRDGSIICPSDQSGWRRALAEQVAALGLSRDHPLSERIHKIFLPVWLGNDPQMQAAQGAHQ